MEEVTQEQIEQSISAAFDSVNLINELNVKQSLTEQEEDTKARNIEHLSIMLAKEWFSTTLHRLKIQLLH